LQALSADEGGTGDLRFVLNKSEAGNVLSQLYQRGYSGRAEMGLIGSDDFCIRVSPDGSQWRDALLVSRETGMASFPNGIANLPRANLLLNPAFAVNQRRFAGGFLGSRSLRVRPLEGRNRQLLDQPRGGWNHDAVRWPSIRWSMSHMRLPRSAWPIWRERA
jgi:hypothetical protein